MTVNSVMRNQKWEQFLSSQGAQRNELDLITTFGQPELERYLIKNGPVVTDLSHMALIKVSGADAKEFLQGQLSSDINEVTENKAQMSAYCDPQGNALAIFNVFKYIDNYYLAFENTLLEVVTKRLNMFILRSDVTLTIMNQDLVQIGFAGEFGDLDIQRRLNTKVKEIWETGNVQQESLEDVLVIKVPGPYHKYYIVGPCDQMIEVWKQIRINSDVTNYYDWQLLDIAAGVPSLNQYSSGQYTAQFLNLDKFNAINFKKGCFPGQEIIARLHYRGKVAKRMVRLRLESEKLLEIATSFYATDEAGTKIKFDMIAQQADIFGGSLALAITTLKPLEKLMGELSDESGQKITIEPLPYRITEEE
jgi:folate-binding protein YgfZ